MATITRPDLLGRLRGVIGNGSDQADGQLLSWYVAERAEQAFAAIVRRHGGMVLGVCRRVLGNVHDADDAFQATFLVLVRKAASVVPRDNLAAWLHGVAYRTALKAKSMRARHQAKEQRAAGAPPVATGGLTGESSDVRPILDRELAALPDYYRLPIVLCDLEGKSRKEAARQLSCNEGTLSGRLARGRRLLGRRLTRQGVALGTGGLAVCLSQQALAVGPPAPLVSATLKAAALVTAGHVAAVPAAVAELTREVLQAMLVSNLKSYGALAVTISVGLALALGSYGALAGQEQQPERRPTQLRQGAKVKAVEREIAGKLYLHRGQDLALFDARGKDFANLPPLDEQHRLNYQARSAKLSPSGKYLAFGQANQGRPPFEIQVREVGKDAAPTVLASMPDLELSSWVWSPDEKKITFAVWDEGDQVYYPWIVDVASKKTEKVQLPALPGKGEAGFGAVIHAWTPDGLWVAFAKGSFHLVDPRTKEARQLNREPTGFMADSVRVAPDGKKLLYLVATMEHDWTLQVIDLLLGKTSTVAKLRNKADVSACWSPDSRHIACSHADANEQGRPQPQAEFRVEVYPLDGATPRVLVQQAEWLTVTDWR
jgi:RNA polymerase sigma factor (sigma-70 family)